MTAVGLGVDEARRHASETVKKSGTSFAAGMAILPKPRRNAMHAIYAFCREVDDIADEDGLPREERLARLADWRAEIDRVFAGAPGTPTGRALVAPVRAFDLPREEFVLMIEGMEMDARGPVVAPDFETYRAYTRRVAGAVGLLSMPAFGAPKGAAPDRFALALADAFQTTNVLRDVGEDAGLGRLYLPRELLEKHGAPLTPSEIVGAPGLAPVAEELGRFAAEKFAEARAALGEFDWRTVRPALLMMGVYETYLKRLEARGWGRTGEGLSMSKAEKALISARWLVAPRLSSPA
ncbi:MAG: squalene/phytoene synthase family protein [Parvularculaceae bacterium]